MMQIEGLPEMPISGLRISDVIASGKTGVRASFTDALELRAVQANARSGPAFLVKDSKELEMDAVSTRAPLRETPVIRLEHCPDAIVRNSKAFPGTGTFLSAPPGELQKILLQGNALDQAQKATEELPGDFR